MFYYYFTLALRSLRRNVMLTALMIVTIGVGIGASTSALAIFRALSGNPIPQKSSQLFVPRIDALGPKFHDRDGNPFLHLSYVDAQALLQQHIAKRQAVMYFSGFSLTPENPDLLPFQVLARATTADFFALFDVPFQYGSTWSAADDDGRADVVVLTRALNEKYFGGVNSVGKTVRLDKRDYRVMGVIDTWAPLPRFYEASDAMQDKVEDLFLPFSTAVSQRVEPWDNVACNPEMMKSIVSVEDMYSGTYQGTGCIWLRLWVELPTTDAVQRYRSFLDGYVAEQQRSGRFSWPPMTKLLDVEQVLNAEQPVPNNVRLYAVVCFSFLLVCLINAIGLMLAKFMGRAAEVGVRRALGAKRRDIMMQCLIETGVIGLVGGVLGLALSMVGLAGVRAVTSGMVARATFIDSGDVMIAVLLSIIATLLAGLYPTWRAMRIQPAWQLKVN